jgi:hypothetical protein
MGIMDTLIDGLYLAEDITDTTSKGIVLWCRRTKGSWYLVSYGAAAYGNHYIGNDEYFLKHSKPLTYFPGVPVELKDLKE